MGAAVAAQAVAVAAAEYQPGEETTEDLLGEEARKRVHHRTVGEYRQVEVHQEAAGEEAEAENLTQRAIGSGRKAANVGISPYNPCR